MAKTALRDVPKTKDRAIEISVINPLFQANGGSQKVNDAFKYSRSSTCSFKCVHMYLYIY